MAKKVTEQDDRGNIVTHSKTKARLIEWTPGPQTRAQRIKRALFG